jgi:glycine/serine hydroxymethyltransferase
VNKPKRCCYYCDKLSLVSGHDRLIGLCMKHGITMDCENGLCENFQEKTVCLEYLKQLRAKYANMTPEERYGGFIDDTGVVGGILFKE